ncbi:hypothetical protein KC571_03190 [candidate division WWE3 bacterium]|uniref:Glycerophosphoryl diester phosphodiesterase membrane domain-containing protein n=1 Tax=candidate division WWE3 bacterium TaxID=2053526 RepID=A0A955RPG4_UNCKA|nr:hypothetical protein [candidate division WWE3 bacterium]
MPQAELLQYIQEQRAEGVSDESIADALKTAGWELDDIQNAFASLASGVTKETSSEGSDTGPVAIQPIELKSFTTLLSESVSFYKEHFATLIGVAVVQPLITFMIGYGSSSLLADQVNAYAAGSANVDWGYVMMVVMGIALVSAFFQGIVTLALMNAVVKKTSVVDSFQMSLSRYFSFIWMSVLMSLIILGGSLFFLIPGFMLSAWFAFSPLIFVDEGRSDLAVLKASRGYIKNAFMAVYTRYFLFGILVFAVLFGASFLLEMGAALVSNPEITRYLEEILNALYSIFGAPFFMVFSYLLYKNVKESKGGHPIGTEEDGNAKYTIFAIIGIFAAIALIGGFYSLLVNFPDIGDIEQYTSGLYHLIESIATFV